VAGARAAAAGSLGEEVEEGEEVLLSPLQQLMQLCGQGTDETQIPSMEQLLASHGFESSRVRGKGKLQCF
jgi:hypothetical protein